MSKTAPMDQEQEEEDGEEEEIATTTNSNSNGSSSSLLELPDGVLTLIFSLVSDVRSRNSLSLSCLRFRLLERSTRLSLSLRGNIRDLFLLPNSFLSVRHLDLSLLSPWGHPFLHHTTDPSQEEELVALRLRLAFPDLLSLVVYARNPSTLSALAPRWGPGLRHASLVRWHQRPPVPPGADLLPLLSSCPSLASLDLSRFYCWSEDVPAALHAYPSSAASLTALNLLNPASVDGFRSSELTSVADACPNLTHFLAPCVFDPRCFGFVDDDTLLHVASSCPGLVQLHLADPATLSARTNYENAAAEAEEEEEEVQQDSRISCPGLEKLFASLPKLEDFALDLCHNVRDAGPALEVLGNKCPRMKKLQVGRFRGICRAAGLHLDGVAVCGGLQSLCIKNSPDLTDAGLVCIARGCRRLSRLEIHGCGGVTATGIRKMAGMLRSTLVDVTISRCRQMDAAASIRSLEPIRDRIERLHIDCIWTGQGLDPKSSPDVVVSAVDEFDTDENGNGCSSNSPNKKCRYSDEWNNHGMSNGGDMDGFWNRKWDRLRYLSLWLPAGVQLSPLRGAGLEDCPELEEICIKIEGDCRGRPAEPVFGLSCLALYPKLSKMKLDCGEATGYALTAPSGQMDLSLWERFYLHGIGSLNLYELDYWPPQDRDVNQRSLSLPAAGLIGGCLTLRKLFIHGTMHEHFMRFFLGMPRLRDVQLREDYYPAPENDMSTEMRVDSCSRFEDALNSRPIPD
ncbi:putative F-box/LRR-repeat MAX2-like protein [Iris pallida]|uniref:F-box/LRR-repeat MAX2-like protein n=1 Tax=Iris pallida TaxID=29817 RepID=A0AAX6EAM7_IRIPA|nr:putative F-box/LRR-repeat MAX2-like protein [Iris pallida]